MASRGRRRCELTLQQVSESQGNDGGIVQSWSTYKTVWADLQPVRGGEREASRQVLAEADSVAWFDWIDAPAVTPKMRVSFGTRTFDILAVRNISERNRTVELQLRERGLG